MRPAAAGIRWWAICEDEDAGTRAENCRRAVSVPLPRPSGRTIAAVIVMAVAQ